MKDKHFRGKLERWIWGRVVDSAMESLDYVYTRSLDSYRNQKGVWVRIHNGFEVGGCSIEIGNKNDLEEIEKRGGIESAIDYLNELEGVRNNQSGFCKIVEEQRLQTGRYVLSKKLSEKSMIAVMEIGKVHDVYEEFRERYLGGK